MNTNGIHSTEPGEDDSGKAVELAVIHHWLSSLAVIFRGHVARAAAEHEAHLRGLITRDEQDSSEVLLRGMWHMFAEAVLRSPLPIKDIGRLLLDTDDQIPAAYRALDLEHPPETPSVTGPALTIAQDLTAIARRLRALTAYRQTCDQVLAVDQRAHTNWRFATQLLGFDPSDQPTQ
ncbi:hypothetical protein H0264_14515 [Nocardia huaxiensis]|uniref:Uncharacterized protein n=1 Tax=Nocardia huaxiensis TaxID=2755382 RepID=A0A7D6VCP4_9NOCA|nr:hypothetical protein [Nocardia huaxiensis]QLY33281.1 hypothetical protein H0264_14515 [Nocardia huaxiensis]